MNGALRSYYEGMRPMTDEQISELNRSELVQQAVPTYDSILSLRNYYGILGCYQAPQGWQEWFTCGDDIV